MNIIIQNLSKSFGSRDILNDFSLDLDSGVRLCVCGPNGSGKSTFIRLLAGEEPPDAGRVIVPRNCRVGYVAQDFDEKTLDVVLLDWVQDVLPDWHEFWEKWDQASRINDQAALSGLGARQSELEAMYGYNPEHRARTVLSGLGFSAEKQIMPIRRLSGGWRERARLARVLTAGADVMLLDEPTNHLDIEAVEWLEEFLLAYRGVLVFVAHDRVFMDKIGTHILCMGGSRPLLRKMNFSKFIELQEELEEQREREARHLADEIERKMDFVRRFGAKATKARQAGSRQKMAKKLEKELETMRPEPKRRELNFAWPSAARADKSIVAAAGLEFHFQDGARLWPPLTLNIFNGQRIALVGPNGCGKSTLLKIIARKLERTGGSLIHGQLVRMGYFSQHQTELLFGNNSVIGEMRRLGDPRTTEEELMSVLGLFMLGQNYFDRLVSTLSGGERARLLLSSLFLARCNFMVLDEPTNHLDLESRAALIDALDAFDGTLLMVAHDRYLLSQVADEAWAVSSAGITVYDGFAAYDAERKQVKISATPQKSVVDAAPGNLNREDFKRIKREQADLRNELYKTIKPKQDQYAKLEAELNRLLAEEHAIETQLIDPVIFSGKQGNELLKQLGAIKNESEKLLETLAKLEVEILEGQRPQKKGDV